MIDSVKRIKEKKNISIIMPWLNTPQGRMKNQLRESIRVEFNLLVSTLGKDFSFTLNDFKIQPVKF